MSAPIPTIRLSVENMGMHIQHHLGAYHDQFTEQLQHEVEQFTENFNFHNAVSKLAQREMEHAIQKSVEQAFTDTMRTTEVREALADTFTEAMRDGTRRVTDRMIGFRDARTFFEGMVELLDQHGSFAAIPRREATMLEEGARGFLKDWRDRS